MQRALMSAAVALAAAGCAAGFQATPAPTAIPSPTPRPAPSLPPCATPSLAPVAPLPTGFPTTVPMPPGTYITGARSSANQVVVDAIVPGSLAQAAAFMTAELPKAGWTITGSDAEMDEAEASFSGAGFTGRFRLHSMTGCNDAVTFTVAVTAR
jgi:hypothetical protein